MLQLRGNWRMSELRAIPALPLLGGAHERPGAGASSAARASFVVDGTALRALDSAAALLLCHMLRARGIDPAVVVLGGFDPRHERTLRQVARVHEEVPLHASPRRDSPLAMLGRSVARGREQTLGYLGFLGIALSGFARALARPALFRVDELLAQMGRVCISAVPVVVLVTALIGVVFAYLLGLQAEQYGASIFVVDGVALGMTREFSPLIVAVIVAGRSGASFAAQLGTMRLNEETDAIRVLGMSVPQVLIVPRVLALVLSMPLLVFVGDVAGVAGAAFVADAMLGITPPAFLDRLEYALLPQHAVIGLVKAPFFALLIAVIGCRMGMTGPRDARTIGVHTTSTVVQSVVGVIVIDALFAVVLQEMGL